MKTNGKRSRSETLDLKKYYEELLTREELPPGDLAAAWTAEDVRAIVADFRGAFAACKFTRLKLEVGSISPQAIGNAVAAYVSCRLKRRLQLFTIDACPGPGFPDYRLVHLVDSRSFILEMKTTARAGANDSRVVLTSTSQKVRALFAVPVCHLVATTHYSMVDGFVRVRKLRLNFLEPGTPVHVRLEASVTPRLLLKNGVWIDENEPPAGSARIGE